MPDLNNLVLHNPNSWSRPTGRDPRIAIVATGYLNLPFLETLSKEGLNIFYTILVSLLVLVIGMGTYSGWYAGQSPYSSLGSETTPSITEADFSYITSADLEDRSFFSGKVSDRIRRPASPFPEDDDIIIIKNNGVTYPAHFPAYSIFDGRVTVKDVRDQLGDMMELSQRATRDIKLLYKGHNMNDLALPVREYGVKNNSEILAVLREMGRIDPDNQSVSRKTSAEDILLLGDGDVTNRRPKKRKDHLDVPTIEAALPIGPDNSESPKAAEAETVATASGLPGSIHKLDEIAAHFDCVLRPQCEKFVLSPPHDPKRRDEEDRKLSETIFQHLLKLDGVEMEGNPIARARRKQLVKETQEVLKRLDDVKLSV